MRFRKGSVPFAAGLVKRNGIKAIGTRIIAGSYGANDGKGRKGILPGPVLCTERNVHRMHETALPSSAYRDVFELGQELPYITRCRMGHAAVILNAV